MRTIAILATILTLSTLAADPVAVDAKMALEASPSSGPPGTLVTVRGIGGFQPDYDVNIALISAAQMKGPLLQGGSALELPEGLPLATIRPGDDYTFKTNVTIPESETLDSKFGAASQDLKIIAIGRNDQLDGDSFAVGEDFKLIGVTPPAAGEPGNYSTFDLPFWALSASLGLAAIAVLAAWRLRRTRPEDAHANPTHRGTEGP